MKQKKVKYKDIPLEFRLAHQKEAEDFCDGQTAWWCYCGKLTTGRHTSTCRQYKKHFEQFIENKFNTQQKEADDGRYQYEHSHKRTGD